MNSQVSLLLEALTNGLDSNQTGQSNGGDERSALWSPHRQLQVHTMHILWPVLFGNRPSSMDEPRVRYTMNVMENGKRRFKPSALLGRASGGNKNPLTAISAIPGRV